MAGCGAATGPAPAASSPPPAEPTLAPALRSAWDGYRQHFIQADGRVVDPQRDGASTSEGQSYALLRAAWMDDHATYDTVWRWTRDNLRTDDGLFAYLWGRRGDGGWGRLSGDSASDADQDIALALLLGAQRWGRSDYRDAAGTVIRAIWDNEVAVIAGRPYLVAGPWARSTRPGPTLNPSYFAPYAYRLFAGVDSDHAWGDVVDSSYDALRACSDAPLGAGRSAGLPPNWCVLDDQGGAQPAQAMPQPDDYGYDAFRSMWRVAVDVVWNGESRGRDWLHGSGALLRSAWTRDGRLASVYHHDGSVASANPDPAAYGADVGALLITDPAAARQIARSRLLPALQGRGDADPDNYYQQNWAWFGLALVAGAVTPPSH